jgi:hypothetical protein
MNDGSLMASRTWAAGNELDEPQDGAEPAFQDVPVVSAEQRGRQLFSVGALADPDARLLPDQDAHRFRGIAEDLFVLGQQRSRVEVPSAFLAPFGTSA